MAASQRLRSVARNVHQLLCAGAGSRRLKQYRALDAVLSDVARGSGSSSLVSIFSELDEVDWSRLQFPGLCHFLPIYQDLEGCFEIAAFYLGAGSRIPLHGHPNQTVLTKVLSGNLAVASYDFDGNERAYPELAYRLQGPSHSASFLGTATLQSTDWAWLGPRTRNIHEFMAIRHDHCNSTDVRAICGPQDYHSTTLQVPSAATASATSAKTNVQSSCRNVEWSHPLTDFERDTPPNDGALVIDLVVPPYLTSWQSNGDPPIERICPYFSVQHKASASGANAEPVPLRQGDKVEVRPAAAAEGQSYASTERAPSWFDTPRHLPVEAYLQLPVDPGAL